MTARRSEIVHLKEKRADKAEALAKAKRGHRGTGYAHRRMLKATLALLKAEVKSRRPPLGRPRIRLVVDGPSLFGEASP